MAAVHVPPVVSVRHAEVRWPALLRLTCRGRVVVRVAVVLAFALVVAGAVLGVSRTASAGARAHPLRVTYRVVLPGETLLGIAAEVDPGSDLRDAAVRIARLNALDGWGLQAGQRLALPVGS
jgi:hypothetical protein